MSANLLLNNLALYCLQIGLVVGLAAFVPAALRLRLPGAKLAYWHFLLAACLFLPAVRPWRQDVVDVTTGVPAAAALVAAPAPTALPAPQPPRFTQAQMLLALLAAGAAARFGWLAVGLWRLRRYRLSSVPATASGADDRFLSSAAGLTVLPDLRFSADIASPVTFGFLKPVILLPTAFPNLNPRIQAAILAHECLHVRRRDWLFTLLEEMVRAVFWFHPAIWWLLGEIQLSREQVVDRASVDMTRSREEYVDALLAIAGVRPRLDLAPAPLFLRKRHLKHRVVSILKEVRMSKKHSISALAAGLCILAAACWLVTGTFTLSAAPQMVADEPGVSVDLGGAALMHRTRVEYPAAAKAGHIEGLVVVQATVDSAGNVTDARVISGPDELRKTAIQAVLQWHFARGGSSTRTVSLMFRLPAENSQPAPAAIPTVIIREQIAPQPSAQSSAASAEFAAIQAQQSALMAQARDANARQDRQALDDLMKGVQELSARRLALQRIRTITTSGLSDQASRELLASLPVHEGDAPTPENMARLSAAVKQIDEHVSVSMSPTASPEEVEIRIAAPASEAAPRIQVGGKVQEASVTRKVIPVYPPLARSTRIQGDVVLAIVIGKDGSVLEIKLVSGHPLLAPAALEAVKQWTYKPTLLNGQPVEVSTQVVVTFSLPDSPPGAQQQQ